MMELLLTLEIKPYDFAVNDYESPRVSPDENPEAWNDFWLKSIADSQFENLEAIRKGAWLVDVKGISNHELAIILKQQLKEVEWDFFEDQIGLLSGGIVLKENNTLLIEPMCCGDLANTRNWEQIFENKRDYWTQLWIGHPWVYYKWNNGNIEFSAYTESSLADFKDIRPIFSVSATVLNSALKKIRTQQNVLQTNIQKVLDKMGFPHANRIAQLMTGNE